TRLRRCSDLFYWFLSFVDPVFFFFFFFQAEDGIRDLIVTGVQTCALPISPPVVRVHDGNTNDRRSPARTSATSTRTSSPRAARRSEERRVGKECRSRWSPEQ